MGLYNDDIKENKATRKLNMIKITMDIKRKIINHNYSYNSTCGLCNRYQCGKKN